MRLPRIVEKHGLAIPVFAFLSASAVCAALIAYRVIAGAHIRHAYLVWNLFLAWLPLLFALLAVDRHERKKELRDPGFISIVIAWLLFFPNAPYIFTDLVHVLTAARSSFWSELFIILLCAMTGFLTGCLSLQLMHGLATRLWGRLAGWMFVAAASGLAGFGVYLGRFVRLNSWNVLTHPLRLMEGASLGAWTIATEWHHAKFLILFSTFLLAGYGMLYALMQQRHDSLGLARRHDY